MSDRNAADYDRYHSHDIEEDPDPADDIEAIRTSLSNLRATWRHRTPEQVDAAIDDLDSRLWLLATVDGPVADLLGQDGARDVLRAARRLPAPTKD